MSMIVSRGYNRPVIPLYNMRDIQRQVIEIRARQLEGKLAVIEFMEAVRSAKNISIFFYERWARIDWGVIIYKTAEWTAMEQKSRAGDQ
jgi:hypothetical protein